MDSKNKETSEATSCSGQTMIFMIMALIIISFVLLWNIDLHKIIHLKSRTQNAGDAAALSAARWQGLTLNLIGDLNIMQAIALTISDTNSISQIPELQTRLCYAGPMIGLLAAQQAAKNNGIYVSTDFTSRLLEHANAVIEDYPGIFPEPYANCWDEYGQMLLAVSGEGVAAAPDNARLYADYSGEHTLLYMNFYDAVAGQDWCWFYWYDLSLLDTYTDYQYWPALPPIIIETHPCNSEIFGLGLETLTATVPGGTSTISQLNIMADERDLSSTIISNSTAEMTSTWAIYNQVIWTSWSAMSLSGDDPFPACGEVRPQYDYAGADTAIRIETSVERITPGSSDSVITWTAAAKPFGYLPADGSDVRPDQYSLVLPAFHNVRLIPTDTSSAPAGGSYDLTWREHIEVHLANYMESGTSALDPDCWYCQQLLSWENSKFRAEGMNWLTATNSSGDLIHTCETSGGPGSGPGGGRRRGH